MSDFYLQTMYIVNAPYAVGKLYSCSLGLLTMNTASLTRMPYTHQLLRHRCRSFHVLELMSLINDLFVHVDLAASRLFVLCCL